ncbi:MAG: hypothetical protein DDT19_02216 [Syntrophomonadaceae bacterium]|nr:hypothetical protein [Bacillota bacterium]
MQVPVKFATLVELLSTIIFCAGAESVTFITLTRYHLFSCEEVVKVTCRQSPVQEAELIDKFGVKQVVLVSFSTGQIV